MKKFIAGTLAAALMACPMAAYAEGEAAEPAAAGYDVDVVTSINADGQEMRSTANVKVDSEMDASVSINLTVPGGESGDVSIDLEDYVRAVGGKYYVNAAAIADFMGNLTGSEDFSQILAMVGVQDWIEIEEPQIVLNQEAVSDLMGLLSFTPSEELTAALTAIIEPISVEETEDSYVISVDNDTVIAVADKIDDLLQNHMDEILEMLGINKINSMINIIDYRASFTDYVEAYAGGRASVTGEDPAEITENLFTTVENIGSMLSQQAKMMVSFISIPDLSDAVTAAFEGAALDGQITVAKDFTLIDGDVAITADEQTGHALVHAEVLENGLTSSASVVLEDQVLAASNLDIELTENGISEVFSVVSNGEEVFNSSLEAGFSDTEASCVLSVSAYGEEQISAVVKAEPTEDGAQGTFTLNAAGEPVLDGSFAVSTGENGYGGIITLDADDVNLVYQISVPATLDSISYNLAVTQGEETTSISGTTSFVINEAAADLDITAPESFVTVYDVIYNGTALYYQLQAAQEEAETEEAIAQ